MTKGYVRIIAGKWRGRRLSVPAVNDLRPTPDRVRETVFNWLTTQTGITGARCLDLFAGSGALGFEALSRGAAYVEMVDQSATVIDLLRTEWQELAAGGGEDESLCRIYRATVPEGLQPSQPFDIVFIDPPYRSPLLLSCCFYLEANGFLSKTAYLYLEAQEDIKDNDLPKNWRILKSRTAGQVHYHLAMRKTDE